jgi:hypothetical protein
VRLRSAPGFSATTGACAQYQALSLLLREGFFFEAETNPVHGPPDSAITDNNTTIIEFGLKSAQADMALRCNALTQPILMSFQQRSTVPAHLANRHIAGLAQLGSPAHRRGPTNRESLSRLARAVFQTIARRASA